MLKHFLKTDFKKLKETLQKIEHFLMFNMFNRNMFNRKCSIEHVQKKTCFNYYNI